MKCFSGITRAAGWLWAKAGTASAPSRAAASASRPQPFVRELAAKGTLGIDGCLDIEVSSAFLNSVLDQIRGDEEARGHHRESLDRAAPPGEPPVSALTW